MSTPVRISMLDLLRTGGFSDLPFGIKRDAIIQMIGDTEWVVFSSRRDRHPSLLRYGNVEFFVTTDSSLLYGFLWKSTNTEMPKGTSRVQIEPWILRGGVSRASIEQGLREEKIAFTGQIRADGVYSLSLISGVSVDFFGASEDEDSDTICAVSVMRSDLLPDCDPTKQISVTLAVRDVERIKLYAKRQSVSVANLCAEWIRDRLRAEENMTERTASEMP